MLQAELWPDLPHCGIPPQGAYTSEIRQNETMFYRRHSIMFALTGTARLQFHQLGFRRGAGEKPRALKAIGIGLGLGLGLVEYRPSTRKTLIPSTTDPGHGAAHP